MTKTFATNSEFQASASSDDVLSPATAYTLYIYKQDEIVYTHAFTTATLAVASANSQSVVSLNGGLLSNSASTKAPLVIEYKASEFTFFPFIFLSASIGTTSFRANNTDILSCSTASLVCLPSLAYSQGFAATLSSTVSLHAILQAPNATKISDNVAEGTFLAYYNTKLITE